MSVVLLVIGFGIAFAANPVPNDFVDELVPGLDNLTEPTALAFLPDNSMLIVRRAGVIRRYTNPAATNGTLEATPLLDISGRTCANAQERGLLGLAIDPNYRSNGFIYVYYTGQTNGTCTTPRNRVSRFTVVNNVANDNTERILINNIFSSSQGNHNAGDLAFGKDGLLYISVGDAGCDYNNDSGCQAANDAARDPNTLLGKILRIIPNPDLTPAQRIPGDNPFRSGPVCAETGGSSTAGFCQETYAWGFRNPFRFAFDPNTPSNQVRFFVDDVGDGRREEINLAAPGADFGWNCREGSTNQNTGGKCNPRPANMVDPIFEYAHDGSVGGPAAGCRSITGGAFVPNGLWPGYDGTYIFGDYVCGKLFTLRQNGSTWSASDFVTGLGGSSAVHLAFGPVTVNGTLTQALYYTDYTRGDVRRMRFVGAVNRAPTAAISASPTAGADQGQTERLTVNFNASASSDPDSGDSIVNYEWDFGDGSARRNTSGPTTSYTYNRRGQFTATVRVRDNNNNTSTNSATVRIDVGNNAPVVEILSPAAGATFTVGQQITLRGRATDAEDGTIADGNLRWEVRRHHDDHWHPYLQAGTPGNNLTISGPDPEDIIAATNSYLEIRLSVTDSRGVTTLVTHDMQPQQVTQTFLTQPAGLRVIVDTNTNDNTVTAPASIVAWPGQRMELNIPAGQVLNGQTMRFCAWSQGGPQEQTITVPNGNQSYTAVFAPEGQPCGAIPTQPPVTSPTTVPTTTQRIFLPLVQRAVPTATPQPRPTTTPTARPSATATPQPPAPTATTRRP
ncbi:MAG: PQQ-dependent sugar dehydrogenase [Chloroflexaceae bacterium]|nr:PQQ-dependent sugar dehydrogenase [Chloroflexaceae bacterium]